MKDFVDAMGAFVEMSKQIKGSNPYNKKYKKNRWLKCVRLLEEGWKNEDCEDFEDSDDLIFVWKKNDQIQKVRLSFLEQKIWLEYLEKNFGSKDE
jgi:hypothetical protein